MKFIFLSFLGDFTNYYFNKYFINYFYNNKLIFDLIKYYNSNSRFSNSSQKNRALVKHTTKKIYKQKGLGRSRVGSSSSPNRKGGGLCFPNLSYENYHKYFNKIVYKLSLFFIYSQIFFENKIFIIDDFFLIFPKTKFLVNRFNLMFLNFNFVIFSEKINKNFLISSFNIFNLKIFNFLNFNPNFIFKFNKILITKSFLKYLEKKFL